MTCDYNGWNDAPEEEREWFDQHPEIWTGTRREGDNRPLRMTLEPRPRGSGAEGDRDHQPSPYSSQYPRSDVPDPLTTPPVQHPLSL
jgi:hypothetical protein